MASLVSFQSFRQNWDSQQKLFVIGTHSSTFNSETGDGRADVYPLYMGLSRSLMRKCWESHDVRKHAGQWNGWL